VDIPVGVWIVVMGAVHTGVVGGVHTVDASVAVQDHVPVGLEVAGSRTAGRLVDMDVAAQDTVGKGLLATILYPVVGGTPEDGWDNGLVGSMG
jgi:hypothetical protein